MKRSHEHSGAAVAKATKTMAIRHKLPHMSASAFSAFVKLAQQTDLSDVASSRGATWAAKFIASRDIPFGPILWQVPLQPKPPHRNYNMVVVNPFAYLYNAFKANGGFHRMMTQRLQACPNSFNSPWRLVVYSDEVVPGNQLAVQNSREFWIIYFSFVELQLHLHDEDAWCPLVAEASDGLSEVVQAGISQAFCAVLKLFFGSHTHDFRNGIQLQGPDGATVRFHAVLSAFLQDGGAHRAVWCCKGDSGTRLCMLCNNLVAKSSSLTDHDGSNLLVCSLIHANQMNFASDSDIRGAIARLTHFKAIVSKGDFKRREQACGFTYQPCSILLDAELDDIVHPATQFMHDWMHGMFGSGVFNIILFQILLAVQDANGSTRIWSDISNYLKVWQWPALTKFDSKKSNHFNTKRVKAYKRAAAIKCPASDGLNLIPVIAYFITTVVSRSGVCPQACDAFLAMCDVVEALQCIPLGLTGSAHLKRLIDTLLLKCEAAQWEEFMIPKFHWLVHYPHALERWGLLITCWVHERKHKMAKRYATNIQNRVSYAKSVLSEVISHQLDSVTQEDAFNISLGLIDAHDAPTALEEFMLNELGLANRTVRSSTAARVPPLSKVSRTDVVLLRSADGNNLIAGQLWSLANVEDKGDVALVSLWKLQACDMAIGCGVWQMTDEPCIVSLSQVLESVIWTEHTPGFAKLLIPPQFRGFMAVNA